VVVVPHDPQWPLTFEALKEVYLSALGELVVTIEHVGSTAVPNLSAKPIIDIDVVIPSREVLAVVIHRLGALGYRHQGDLGVFGREALTADGADDVPRAGAGRRWPMHNLYVCATDCEELRRHLAFRDWLRSHPARAAEYGALKRQIAQVYHDNREGYTEAKTEFIEAALRELAGSQL
jgi:GrpB-like predicted nucleotidyltransferase (UPF0157 family)